MRLRVRVPVLSVHSTVIAPSASIAGVRRTRAWCRAIRQAPSARNTASTTGNSSGMVAIASVRPARIASASPPRLAMNKADTSTAVTSAKPANRATTRRISRCIGVGSTCRLRSETPILPTSVRAPVAVTSATP